MNSEILPEAGAGRLPTKSSTLIEAAHIYVELGFAPIPVYGLREVEGGGLQCACGAASCSAGKHPIGATWQKRAPRTVDEARDRFRAHDGNIGLYLGGTGLLVVDFDGAVGLATRDGLAGDGLLPRTLTARSGSGGEHRVYRFAVGQDAKRISDRSKVLPGVDVKRNGQFLAAPSRHVSGGYYAWIDGTEIAELPDALFDRLATPVRPKVVPIRSGGPNRPQGREPNLVTRARAYIATMPAAVSGAGGHDAIFAVARKLAQDFGLSRNETWMLLAEYNERCQPPWSDKELRHKLEAALDARVSNPITDRPRPGFEVPDWHLKAPLEEEWEAIVPDSAGRPGMVPRDDRVDLTKDGDTPAKTAKNVARMLALYPRGVPRWDRFSERVRWPDGAELVDTDALHVQDWLLTQRSSQRVRVSVENAHRGIELAAHEHEYDSLVSYIDGLPVWDGTPRIDLWLVAIASAPDTEVVRLIGRKWLVGAIARALQPGCRMDSVLVLEGPQGVGKNRLLEALFGERVKSIANYRPGQPEAARIACSSWCVHDDEFGGAKSDVEALKAFVSSTHDTYRMPYGRAIVTTARRSVLVASTNRRTYLSDAANRRFWPVAVGEINVARALGERDQFMAEALAAYRGGDTWWLTANHDGVRLEQEVRQGEDPLAERLGQVLTGEAEITMSDILSKLGVPDERKTVALAMRVGGLLRAANWRKERRMRTGGAGERVYVWSR